MSPPVLVAIRILEKLNKVCPTYRPKFDVALSVARVIDH
ncbi:hypothetical protein SAMN05216402_2713 [Nitrosospira multiformis]|uniref:Uncharacterized protein n=1 Tax=Nitrosospira multiformis TaxID=1231 RepID=A0ABY0TIJ6_9PROT|nr:hypothetical protein SAMN05216402_2713 [Nitrosospira multiformis]